MLINSKTNMPIQPTDIITPTASDTVIPTINCTSDLELPKLVEELDAMKQLKNQAAAREDELKAMILAKADGKPAILAMSNGQNFIIKYSYRNIAAKAAYTQKYLTYSKM